MKMGRNLPECVWTTLSGRMLYLARGLSARALLWQFLCGTLRCAVGCGKLGVQLADQRASNQPRQCFDKKIARKMVPLFHRPFTHRLMTHHHRCFTFIKFEPRRAVRQPANVFKRLSQQASRLADQAPVVAPSGGTHEGKYQAFGQLRAEKSVAGFFFQVTHEEAKPCFRQV